MKAAIFDAPHQMHVGHWRNPELGPDDVLISVKAAGICAGDLYIYTGKNPYTKYPIIGGHEICGVVAGTGSNVTGMAAGQLVVVEPFLSCGRCYACRVGKPNCCTNLQIIGVHRAGGYAEDVVVPATHVHAVPAGMSPLRASFAEPVTIAIHACRRGTVSAGEYVLVLGCGPIGLALIEVALARGARVVAVDIMEPRLETARTLGAEVLKSDERLLERVLEQTNQEGAPVVIEATGNPRVMESTAQLVAAGGRIVVVGLVPKGVQVQFPGLDFTRKEMTILGSRTETNCFPEALDLLAGGRLRYPEVATAFDLWSAPEVFGHIVRTPNAVHKGVFVRN
ncbi:MAG: alcohol dehydrogenase catalytic domain-containing protein [Verrucomicrobia bacterium]|nr:alcohol dehydrogenase catalytic domain-containing protein [Verrucomicrobiota bacterium]